MIDAAASLPQALKVLMLVVISPRPAPPTPSLYVQIIEAQVMDLLTGLARGDQPSGLDALGGSDWARNQAEAGLYAIGFQPGKKNLVQQ